MVGSSLSSSGSRSSDVVTPPVTFNIEPQETLLHRRSRGGNFIINEGHHHPSPPHDHIRLVKPKKDPTAIVMVKQEHEAMAADLDSTLKWSRDNYVREEMECQRRALKDIAEQRRGRNEVVVVVLSDSDEEATASTKPIRSSDRG
ncbi:hypothetical protein D1007_07511 [Hordeum vulgare]|nr:hypothetical protein D1007_07511 [Hordeum vulgare]